MAQSLQTRSRAESLAVAKEAALFVFHPDERVPLAMLAGRALVGGAECLRPMMYLRAHRDAVDEGVAWNPLLDRLEASGDWPAIARQEVWDGERMEMVDPLPPISEVAPLGRWILQQTKPEALQPLLVFHSGEVFRQLRLRSQVLDPHLMQALFRMPGTWSQLVEHPGFTDEAAAVLQEWVAELLGQAHPEHVVFWGINALCLLGERGHSVTPAIRQWLRAELQSSNDKLLEYAFAVSVRDPSLAPKDAAACWDAAARLDTVRTDARLAGGDVTEARIRVLRSAGATPELFIRALKEFPRSVRLRHALADIPEARRTPEVRAALRPSRSIPVLEALCKDAAPDEFVSWLSRLRAMDQGAAGRVLDAATPEQLTALPRTEVEALLHAAEQKVRLSAIRALGRMAGSTPNDLQFSAPGHSLLAPHGAL